MKRYAAGLALGLASPLLAQAAPSAPSVPAAAGGAGAAAASAAGMQPLLEGAATFISPMGEPFRSEDSFSGAEHWFRGADTNRDGKISGAEMRADADRFFATLDTDHDGELGPDEIAHYESEVAPEIRVASTIGDMSQGKTDSDGNYTPPPYPTRLGAGRYGYLDMPEPVVACDTNFDRGVSKQEFEVAAARRLKMLDTDGDGAIARAELPKLTTRISNGASGADRRHRRGRRIGNGGDF